MTPAAADSRIILSRQTLHRYQRMINAGQMPMADLALWNDEIAVLEAIAEEHPGKAMKIESLVGEWRVLIKAVRATMN